MTVSSDRLFAALDATWPAASARRVGPFMLRDGANGGKRVSAAVLEGTFDDAALDAIEAEGALLIQVRDGQGNLDSALQARGYDVVDPTIHYVAPIGTLAEKPRPVSLLSCWPPLEIQRQIWADGGIGRSRVAVMERACDPKQAFISRFRNRAAGVGFVAIHDGIAMMHALQVEPDFRRAGVARYMVRGMAHWAQGQGADQFALAVTEANTAARALYAALGMTEAARYHYRERTP
jgi:N-acetylglutamate synthase